MRKKVLRSSLMSFVLAIAVLVSNSVVAFAAWGLPASVDVKVDDNDPYTLHGYTVEGYDFYPLEDIAFILSESNKQFDINVNEDESIELVKNEEFSKENHTLFLGGSVVDNTDGGVSFTTKSYLLDGKKITYSVAVLNGQVFMRLTDVFQIFDISGIYNYDTKEVVVDTFKGFDTDFENIVKQGYFDYLHGAYVGSADGTSYYGANEDESVAIASTSKLMTYLLVMEAVENGKVSLADNVKVTKEASRLSRTEDRTLKSLTENDTIPLNELLDVLLVVSSNEAATMLGEHVAGSEKEFVKLMNERAKELGLNTSTFYNAHGLPVYTNHAFASKLQNKMSAKDLYTLTCEVVNEYPQIFDITKKATVSVKSANGFSYEGSSTNRLMFQLDGVDGLKTGTTNRAGACLVGTMLAVPGDENSRIIAVVLGAEDNMERYWKTGTLLQYGRECYLK